jgi:hypothetical protein
MGFEKVSNRRPYDKTSKDVEYWVARLFQSKEGCVIDQEMYAYVPDKKYTLVEASYKSRKDAVEGLVTFYDKV